MEWWIWIVLVAVAIVVIVGTFAWVQARRRHSGVIVSAPEDRPGAPR
jgi:hypothetical protein